MSWGTHLWSTRMPIGPRRSWGGSLTGPVELLFTAGDAAAFIDLLWVHVPAHPGGVLVGALHLPGDHGQILIRVSTPGVGELVVLPGQLLTVADPADARTWSVVDGPAAPRLNLPR